MRDQWIDRWCVLGLLALNAALKFHGLGVNELAGDEPFTVYWAQRPLAELFAMLRTENNPPLHFLLMHAWSACVPLDKAWLRAPSALFSVLTVWPLYRLGHRLDGRPVAVAAALLFTFSLHAYGFAHEARAYSLLVLACTWSVLQLMRAADPARQRSAQVWLTVANVLLVWTHFFGWVMLGLEVLFVLAVPELRTARKTLFHSIAIAVLTYLPYAAVFFTRAGEAITHGTWVEPPGWEEPYNMLMRWSNAPVVAVLFLALVVAALLRKRSHRPLLALLWCGVPLVGLFLVSFLVPVYIDRYLLFASTGWYLLVAQAITALLPGARWRWAGVLGVAVAMAVTFRPGRVPADQPSQVVRQVDDWRAGRTAVIIQPDWYGLTYAWQLDRRLFRAPAPIGQSLQERGVFPLPSPAHFRPDAAWDTVVLVDAWSALTDPQGLTEGTIRARWRLTGEVQADRKVMLRRFQR